MSGVAEMSPKYLMEGALNAIPVGYKQSEVGIIPEDWETKPLGELVEIYSGDSPSKFVFSTEGTPYFKVEQLNNGSVYADTTPYFIHSSKKVLAGSVIFPKRGASILSNKIRVLKHDSFMDTNLMALTCHHGLDELFLYNQLTYRGLDSVADTTSIPQINNKHISPYLVPLPRKAEQTAIANALSEVDALISELEKLIAKKQAIKTATMQQLLTGRTRLPQFALREDGSLKGTKPSELGEIPEDWELQSLQEMATANGLVRGPFGGAIKKEHFTKTGYKVYEQRNAIYATIDIGNYFIDQKKFDELKRFSVSSGDFIVSCSGTIGRIYQIPEKNPEGVINQALLKITLNDNINSKYFHHYFKWDEFQERIIDGTQGGAMKNLVGMAEFKQSLMPVPSLKEEQTAIATILSDMDAKIQALEQRLGKTRQIKQGMMQELLTGKTRLIKPSKEVIHE
ncbi:restriction endonuclease subunit S [Vibrio cholerae]|nr:restriction endonuclease subunit S [Vibrio cholerae]